MNQPIINKSIIFFDGICHLCNGYINFLIQHGSKQTYYAAFQGQTAKKYLSNEQINKLDSIIYFKNNRYYFKSTAVIESLLDEKIFRAWFKIVYIIPQFFRDFIYDLVARNRYSIFGRADTCRIPNQNEKDFILD